MQPQLKIQRAVQLRRAPKSKVDDCGGTRALFRICSFADESVLLSRLVFNIGNPETSYIFGLLEFRFAGPPLPEGRFEKAKTKIIHQTLLSGW